MGPIGPIGKPLGQVISEEMAESATAQSPQQLSTLALRFAKLLAQGAELMNSLAVEASITVSQFSPTHLSNIVSRWPLVLLFFACLLASLDA